MSTAGRQKSANGYRSPRNVWLSFASAWLRALKCPLDELSGKFAKLYYFGRFEKWSKAEETETATAATAAKAMTAKQKLPNWCQVIVERIKREFSTQLVLGAII